MREGGGVRDEWELEEKSGENFENFHCEIGESQGA